MNNEQIKSLLLSIEDAPLDFEVVLSGRKSRKVNGLYKVEQRIIVLHNKNFANDNLLVYTAIHEYAHHLHSCKNGGHLPSRAHTTEFWAIFHRLLEEAEKKNIYTSAYSESKELKELTDMIVERYIKQSGALFIELGRHLLKARELCEADGLRFEDYIDRILCLPRLAAKTAMKSCSYGLNPSVGSDNMRFISGISNADGRERAESAFLAGKSPDSVKMAMRPVQKTGENPRLKLEEEKQRLLSTIAKLEKRLKEVDTELAGQSF